ncbi:hypothetical protein N7463_010379 [Penicillium fimorum]|uniref:Uncharacterized protein n=1 Tax=Penicillium fimorum TaxID=1882269 RepID=A0A9W9XJR7_9EURO|nr:hypothetical protein N7463_010379 [Penicillium fimorum]
MMSVPQTHEDWERLNAKSWELPNYGPGPDFGRGTIYHQDNNEYMENKGPHYDDGFDLEEDGSLEDTKYDRPPLTIRHSLQVQQFP